MTESSELGIFSPDVDEGRVVSMTVGELRKLHMDSWNAAIDYAVGNHGKFEFADERVTVHERVCHFCWNEDIVHTDIGDEDYGEYVCSACGSPLPGYLQDVADQMQAGCCDEPILWCPACGAKVVS